MKKYVFPVIILAILIVAIVGLWFWQRNPFSKEVLKLEILGPSETQAAGEIEYNVKIKNNGNITLQNPDLSFEFPKSSMNQDGVVKRQGIKANEIGDIYPGEEKIYKFKAQLFGKEGEVKTAKATLSYQPENLSAHYESSTTFSTLLKSAPLSFDFDMPSNIETGRPFSFFLNYFSTADVPLTNLSVTIDYPAGFQFSSSTPKAFGQNEWDIALLNKAAGGRIKIEGSLSGQELEQKIFHASLGVWIDDEFVVLREVSKTVGTVNANLEISQKINGQDNYIANPGEALHYEIFFRNPSAQPFNNLSLSVNLSGDAFDFNSFNSGNTQLNQSDNSAVWDWKSVPALSLLGQGQEGKVEFTINLKNVWPTDGQASGFSIKDSIVISGVGKDFVTKINSKLALTQKGYYQDEVFGNDGPVPPKVDQPTTYTIVWTLKNYYNDLKNVKVKAILPANVSLTGKIFPEDQTSKFVFDTQSREIVWTAADSMPAGTGVSGQPLNISFQLSLIPTLGQRGQTASLIGPAKVSADDQQTGVLISSTVLGVDSNVPDDPTTTGKGVVQ